MRPLLKVVALASATHPDAGLLALETKLVAADQAWEALYSKQVAAEDACFAADAPPPPKEPAALDPREFWAAIEARDFVPLLAHKEAWDKYRSASRVWREARDQAERNSGLTAAEDAANTADAIRLAIRDQIISTRARTIGGLIFKARYAASHFPGDPDEEVMRSLVEDLLSLAGEVV